jgi:hypothetical protein
VPLIIVGIVCALRHYGRLNGRVCYIENDFTRFGAFFIPGLIIISANAILFFFIGREIHETLAGAPKTDRREKRKEFRVYLSIFISIGMKTRYLFSFLVAFSFPANNFYLYYYFRSDLGVWIHHVPSLEAQVAVRCVPRALLRLDPSARLPCLLCLLYQREGRRKVGWSVWYLLAVLQEVGADGIEHHLVAILIVEREVVER